MVLSVCQCVCLNVHGILLYPFQCRNGVEVRLFDGDMNKLKVHYSEWYMVSSNRMTNLLLWKVEDVTLIIFHNNILLQRENKYTLSAWANTLSHSYILWCHMYVNYRLELKSLTLLHIYGGM